MNKLKKINEFVMFLTDEAEGLLKSIMIMLTAYIEAWSELTPKQYEIIEEGIRYLIFKRFNLVK